MNCLRNSFAKIFKKKGGGGGGPLLGCRHQALVPSRVYYRQLLRGVI
jgi:hypothetical protein